MPRRSIYNSTSPSVSNGDQAQFQCDNEGNLKVANAGADVIDVTLVADTSIYANNDVLAVPQEITGVFRHAGGRVKLDSIVVLDGDDQGTAIDLVFFNASATLGTINAAISISDADAAKIVGHVAVAAGDFKDYINSMVAVKTAVGLIMEAAAASTSLYIGAVVRSGTPTYTASGIKLKLGFVPA